MIEMIEEKKKLRNKKIRTYYSTSTTAVIDDITEKKTYF